MVNVIEFLIHFDKYIGMIIQSYGTLTYLILFLIIFAETGLVFFTFLPGDTLLFVAGTFASLGVINIYLLFVLLTIAAIVGDNLNYYLGKNFGKFMIRKHWVNQENIEATRRFFHKHGGKTVVLARFIPWIRSFAPFVAGISEMNYTRFIFFNISGAIAWTASFLTLGYFFGSIPWVKENLAWIIIAIVILSWSIPIGVFIKTRRKKKESYGFD